MFFIIIMRSIYARNYRTTYVENAFTWLSFIQIIHSLQFTENRFHYVNVQMLGEMPRRLLLASYVRAALKSMRWEVKEKDLSSHDVKVMDDVHNSG